MRPLPLILVSIFALNAFPSDAEAGKAGEWRVGDRVLVTGSLQRKCAARVESLPRTGFARLAFDRAGCGDATQAYELRRLQRVSFSSGSRALAEGDVVVVKGHLGNQCSGRLREVSRSGYASVELDSLLCADTEALFKASDVRKVRFVPEAVAAGLTFRVGQAVQAPGFHEGEGCRGSIRTLTDNGLASVSFNEQTCAYAGKLYSLTELQPLAAAAPRPRATGAMIFQRVMREIASQKKSKKAALLQ